MRLIAGIDRKRYLQRAYGIEIIADAVGQAHDDIESPVALYELADGGAAQRGANHLLHVAHVEALPGDPRAVDFDCDDRQTGGLLDLDVRGATDVGDRLGGLLRQPLQNLEILSEDLDGDIGPHTGHKLVHPQFDGLAELVVLAGYAF